MKPLSIGIVGGAGPLAGVKMLEYLFTFAGSLYGCYQDSDYPEISLISFPFSDMLSTAKDEKKIRQELSTCLLRLRSQGAAVLVIACNTLHNFLDRRDDTTDFVNLPFLLKETIPENKVPLVLCTSTSRNLKLHKKYYACTYPSAETQLEVDKIIARILKNQDANAVVCDLVKLIEAESPSTIILGCTELSLYAKELSAGLSVSGKSILDPLELAAKKVLEKSFQLKK